MPRSCKPYDFYENRRGRRDLIKSIRETKRGVLAVDPGDRNLGMALIRLRQDDAKRVIVEEKIGDGDDVMKEKMKSYFYNNYEILWVGVFDLKEKGTKHSDVAERVSLILRINSTLKHVISNKNIDLAVEIQEGYKLNAYLLQGLMRPNWVSGHVNGWFGATGHRCQLLTKNQKWRWCFIVKTSKLMWERGMGVKGGIEGKSKKYKDLKLREYRKKITTFYGMRFLSSVGTHFVGSNTKEVRGHSSDITNHFCDALLLGFYHMQQVSTEDAPVKVGAKEKRYIEAINKEIERQVLSDLKIY